MTVYINELKRSAKAWCIWTCSIAFMVVICIMMFPEMKSEMDSVTDVFANMGGSTAAFGMDRLSFGELMGFYGIECGNIMGIGGGFFAALFCGFIPMNHNSPGTGVDRAQRIFSRRRWLYQASIGPSSGGSFLFFAIAAEVYYSSVAESSPSFLCLA